MNQATIRRHLRALAARDEDIRRGLEQVGYPKPRIREAGFETLLSTVVSQQISTDAAAAIMGRVRKLVPHMQPSQLLCLPEGALREAGLSMRKVEYVENLARAIVDREFDPTGLADMNDDEAIGMITGLRGFGRWSAEIYLMFSLQRRDIIPAGDLAIRIGLQKLKQIDESLSEAGARELAEAWSPYRSAGSLFLWHYYRGAPT